MKQIAIIGECMIELNGKPFGEMQQTFGGDTLNAAVYLARGCVLNQDTGGITVSYVTALGTDPISQGMIDRWLGEGINTDLIMRDPQRGPGLYLIQLDDAGERTFLYWRNQSAARYMMQHEQFEDIKAKLATADMIMLSGISLAILPRADRGVLLAALADLQKQGVKIAFDSNFRPALWPTDDDLGTVKATYAAMYATTDLALVTYDDEALIWGDATPAETLQRLRSQGVKKTVVKLGEDGCLAQDFGTEDTARMIKTKPVAKVVDTTSAGDAFNGGFLSAYLADASIADACKRGNAMAGVVIQHRGAIIPKAATDKMR